MGWAGLNASSTASTESTGIRSPADASPASGAASSLSEGTGDYTAATTAKSAAEATAAPHSARQAAEHAISGSATSWSGMWLLGLTFAVVTQAGYFRSVPLAVIGLAALVLAWLVCMVMRRAPAVLFAAVAALTALGAVLDTTPAGIVGPYVPFITWLNLGTMMLGFLLAARLGRQLVIATATCSWVIGMLISSRAEPSLQDWRTVTIFAFYALVVGMAASSAIAAIRRAAESDDESARVLEAVSTAAEREDTARSETFRISRSVHDGPLNTLAAIRMGHSEIDQLRRRCEADGLRIDRLLKGRDFARSALGQTCTTRIIAAASARATLLGIGLAVRVSGGTITVSAAVEAAFRGAVEEALVNVAKHSGVSEAQLSIRSEHGVIEVEISDNGTGADDRMLAPTSIVERCHRVGAAAMVAAVTGVGTCVSLRWDTTHDADSPNSRRHGKRRQDRGRLRNHDRADSDTTAASDLTRAMLTPVARQVASWFVVLFILSTWLASGQLPIGWTAGSAVLAGVVAIGTTFLFPRLELPWWAKVALVISALALTSLPGTGVSGPQRVGLAWWGADAGMLMVMLVVIATGSRAWTWLAYGGYLTGIAVVAIEMSTAGAGNDATPVLLAVVIIESGAIFGFWKLRQLIERLAQQATAQRAEAAVVRSRTLAAQERDRVRHLWLGSALAPTRDLLTAIATGTAEPQDAAIRSACARQETLLRSLIQIDPEIGQLGDALIRVISWAATQRLEVQVRFVATAPPPSQAHLARIEVALRDVLAAAPRGHPAVLTLGSSGLDDGWLLVVFPTPLGPCDDDMSPGQVLRPGRGAAAITEEFATPVDVTWSRDDDQFMVEISWRAPTLTAAGEFADQPGTVEIDADELEDLPSADPTDALTEPHAAPITRRDQSAPARS